MYIRFTSDSAYSDEDSLYVSSIAAGLVVDNIVVTGGVAYSEDFEGQDLNPNVSLVNSTPTRQGFGLFARLQHHPPDLDPASDDTTCAWVFTDPSYFCNADGIPCVHSWIYNVVTGPWLTLSGLGAPTVLSFREWPGQPRNFPFRIVRNWSVRMLAGDCVGPWQHAIQWNTVVGSAWTTRFQDLTPFVGSGARAIQVRFQVADWSYLIGGTPPGPEGPSGGGPYIDRVRLGRPGSVSGTPPNDETAAPVATVLHQNTPNPFNPTTTIRFDLARAGRVELRIFDVAGRRVRTLVDARMPADRAHAVTWNGLDDAAQRLSSGVYLYRLVTGNFTATRRLVMLK